MHSNLSLLRELQHQLLGVLHQNVVVNVVFVDDLGTATICLAQPSFAVGREYLD